MTFKHDFVSDNPYLVYSSEPDTAASDIGGGGGSAGGGISIVTFDRDNGRIDVPAGELVELMKGGFVVAQAIEDAVDESYCVNFILVYYDVAEYGYEFAAIVEQSGSLSTMNFIADTADDKPVVDA